ncbi:MAG: hypothetical protein ABI431_00440 [Candidatus Tumulicola sp.]
MVDIAGSPRFRDFMGTDLTLPAPHNFFSTPYTVLGLPMGRFVGYDDWARRQFTSFESVFGPTDAKGNLEPLFDRTTGAIDPTVARYWEIHELHRLGSDAEIEVVPGRDHWTIFDAHHGLTSYIVQEATAAYLAGNPTES